MHKPYNRIDRIAEELAHNTTQFLHDNISEQWGMITCTHVQLSSDLHSAKFFLSFYPPLKKDDQLATAITPIKQELVDYLNERVPMRRFPKPSFEVDKSIEESSHINQLMDKL